MIDDILFNHFSNKIFQKNNKYQNQRKSKKYDKKYDKNMTNVQLKIKEIIYNAFVK